MNGILEYFEKQNIYSKTSVISLVILMPFWYISLFLINPSLFYSIDIILRIVLSFCFSVLMYFIQYLFIAINDMAKKKKFSEKLMHMHFILAGVVCIICICGSIVLSYQVNDTMKYVRISYKSFVFLTYGLVIITGICHIIVDYIGYKIGMRKKKKIIPEKK